MNKILKRDRAKGFTMIEMLTVIVILAVLISLLFPALNKMKKASQSAKAVFNLRQITTATIRWAADNGDKLPSPIYPGGESDDPETLPQYWDYQGTGTGLWLDGVVYAAVYVERDGDDESEAEAATSNRYSGSISGGHIKGSFFEAPRGDPDDEDYYHRSYAMNANLAYDPIHDDLNTAEPFMTEKTRSRLVHAPNALLFIDCAEKNVVMATDYGDIEQAIEQRWDGVYGIGAFLDGHVAKLFKGDIPNKDAEGDETSSRFWRGVDPVGFER